MNSSMKTKKLRIGGMSCINCQNKVARKLKKIAGVMKADVNYGKGTAVVDYDSDVVSLSEITQVIEDLDYRILKDGERGIPGVGKTAALLAIILLMYILLERLGLLDLLVPSYNYNEATNAGYGMLFVIGLITSVHCIAMCGGINLSQSIPRANAKQHKSKFAAFIPTFLYNFGRVISYTIVGLVLGFAGMIIGGSDGNVLSTMFQGILKLIAGVVMLIMGISMLGLFPWFRTLQSKVFRMPRFLKGKINTEKIKGKGPLFVGFLNGFMPCGPLQSIQILALASGNPVTGAISMFMFSVGTVPLMLGMGSVVSALGKKFTNAVMTVGSVLVIVLGLAMLSQGGNLSGLMTPTVLVSGIAAFSAAGIVSSIPFRKRSYKAASTLAALCISVLVFAAFNPFNALVEPATHDIEDGAYSPTAITTKLDTHGMTCSACVNIITKAVTELSEEVYSVEVSLSDRTVTVIHEPTVTADAIKESIIASGYRVP
ncbi:MAG: copper ion binding protein [Oscillospiraceae bacterium]|nr:copper ion binding protein [Oscillospiraceae bacterium]